VVWWPATGRPAELLALDLEAVLFCFRHVELRLLGRVGRYRLAASLYVVRG
jgi:hypothetical protein